jgi:hypothetical protein
MINRSEWWMVLLASVSGWIILWKKNNYISGTSTTHTKVDNLYKENWLRRISYKKSNTFLRCKTYDKEGEFHTKNLILFWGVKPMIKKLCTINYVW